MSVPLQATVGADVSNFLQAMNMMGRSVNQTTDNASRKFKQLGDDMTRSANQATVSSQQLGDAQGKVGEQINNTTTALGAFTPILHTVRGLMGALGITIGAFSAINFVKQSIAGAESLNALKKQTGLTVESLSALKFVAEQNETSLEAVTFGVRMLQRNLANADEDSKAARRGLQDLGFTAEELKGGMNDLEGFIVKVAQRLNDLGNDTRRNQIQMQLFGRGGSQLAGVLQVLARDGFEGVRKEAAKFNAVISTEFAEASDRFNDNISKISSYLGGFGRNVLAPMVQDFANFLDRLGLGGEQAQQIATIEHGMSIVAKKIEDARLRIRTNEAIGHEKEAADARRFLSGLIAEYQDFQDQLVRLRTQPPKGKVVPGVDLEKLRKELEELAKMHMESLAPIFKDIDEAEQKAISGVGEFNDIMKKLGAQGLTDVTVKMKDLDLEANKMIVTVISNAQAAGLMDEDVNKLIARIKEWVKEEKRVIKVNEDLKITMDDLKPAFDDIDKKQEEAISLGVEMNKVYADLAKLGLTDTEKKLKDIDTHIDAMILSAIKFGDATGQSVDHIIEKLEALREEQKDALVVGPIAENLANSLTSGLSKTIEGIMLGTRQDFKGLGRNIAISIAQGISEEFLLKPMRAFMKGLLTGLLKGLVGDITEDAEKAGNQIGKAIRRGIGDIFNDASASSGASGGGLFGSLFGGIGSFVTGLFGGDVGSTPPAFESAFSDLDFAGPTFQFGGKVPGPIGAPVRATVHGGEMITPAGGGSLGVDVYVINNTGEKTNVSRDDAGGRKQVYVTIGEEMAQNIRFGGSVGRAITETYKIDRREARR